MLTSSRQKTLILLAGAIFILLITFLAYNSRSENDDGRTLTNFNCPQTSTLQTDWAVIEAKDFTAQQVVDYFYWTNSTSCTVAHDFGGQMKKNPRGLDGQKAVCLDPQVAPNPVKCLVYSIGISNEWSFDDLMEKYGCEVYAFDPSMSQGNHNRSAKIHFYKLGLGDRNFVNKNNWTIKDLSTIYKDLGHEGRIIDYLKMDIEGSEWEVIPQIQGSGMLKKVRQMGVEFHWKRDGSLDRFRSFVSTVKSLEEAGMVRFDSKANIFWRGKAKALNYKGPLGFEIAWYQFLPTTS